MSLPAAKPAYILRGHAAQIHSATFIRGNTRLVTGDAEGWIVVWSLATKRAVAVWKAHGSAILGTAAWSPDRLITHGKDNKLIVWKFTEADEDGLSHVLPVEDLVSPRRQPWLLHILPVNTLNFCIFAHCRLQGTVKALEDHSTGDGHKDELLVAVPNALKMESIDIFHLPTGHRVDTLSGDTSIKTGMVMALSIFYTGTYLTVIAGYESGHTMVTQQFDDGEWHMSYMSQPYSQPVLSLDVDSTHSYYVTSSADAIIAKHPIPTIAGVNPSTTPSVPAATARIATGAGGASLLSAALSSNGANGTVPPTRTIEVQKIPVKIAQTKHSGQQSLRVRSDGKIFATAGWDSRVRVYSTKTLKELAVLKWHKEGCYAVAFATVHASDQESKEDSATENGQDLSTTAMVKPTTTMSVRDKRSHDVAAIHWLAAGSKDGKISLWDIY